MLCSAVAGAVSHSKHELLEVFTKGSTSLAQCFTSKYHGWLTSDRHWPTADSFLAERQTLLPSLQQSGVEVCRVGQAGHQEESGVWHSSPALPRTGYFCKNILCWEPCLQDTK